MFSKRSGPGLIQYFMLPAHEDSNLSDLKSYIVAFPTSLIELRNK